jgi:hypothetical protein
MQMTTNDIVHEEGGMITVSRCPIRVAGVTFLAEARTKGLRLDVQPRLRPFMVEADTGDTEFGVYYEDFPSGLEVRPENQVFDSTGGWRLYERGDGYLMTFMLAPHETGAMARPSEIVRFDRAFSKGDLFIRPRGVGEARSHADGSVSVSPWHYPLEELLLVNRIAHLDGVLIHACGVIVNGEGHLFTGVSGAGKSTLAELWKARGVPILSDERVVVRCDGDQLTLHGTPRFSTAGTSLPDSAPLASVNFLRQSSENYLRPISAAEAVTLLLVTCYPTIYFKVGMENTISLLAKIASSVPAWEFGFRPDQTAIDCLLESWGES